MALLTLEGIAPRLPDGFCWVAESAQLIGRVVLEKEASVWFGAVLRGDNEEIRVGARSNVQDLCVLHTDPGYPLVIEEGCTIGHRAILHGCTLGAHTLVGMGAIVLNGATIGENCLIGAGALVTEGKQIPPGSLVVGAPGRVARTLTSEEIAGLRHSADRYVANARRHAAGLTI